MPVGTRLCAYWSQQYRCLYPGRAIESEPAAEGAATTPISSTPQDFVSVEFDDGDSGRIRLKNIRLLLSNYPIAGVCAGHFSLSGVSTCLHLFPGMKLQVVCQARKAELSQIANCLSESVHARIVVSFPTFCPVLRILCSHYLLLLCCCFCFVSPARSRFRLCSGSGFDHDNVPSRCRVQR